MDSSYYEQFWRKHFVRLERISQFFEIKTFAREISQSVFIRFFFKIHSNFCAFVSSFEFRNDMQYITVGLSSHQTNQSHDLLTNLFKYF